MTKGIPFIKIADTVEVSVDLKAKRISGTPLTFKLGSLQLFQRPRLRRELWSKVERNL